MGIDSLSSSGMFDLAFASRALIENSSGILDLALKLPLNFSLSFSVNLVSLPVSYFYMKSRDHVAISLHNTGGHLIWLLAMHI